MERKDVMYAIHLLLAVAVLYSSVREFRAINDKGISATTRVARNSFFDQCLGGFLSVLILLDFVVVVALLIEGSATLFLT